MNESYAITANFSDRQAISELIYAWAYHRDRGDWEHLIDTFWPDATISLSWFDGPFEQFVEASRGMAEKRSQAKHLVFQPLIKTNDNRAVSETNFVLFARGSNGFLEIDLTTYGRFYDLLEKREGSWRICKRKAIYERDRMDPVKPSLLFWILCAFINLKKYPKSCRFLCFALEKAGYERTQNIVEDNSNELDLLYKSGDDWLLG